MSSYPKWLYHPTEPAKVVQNEAEHKALGPEWVESPADVKPKETKKAGPVVEHKPDLAEHPKKK